MATLECCRCNLPRIPDHHPCLLASLARVKVCERVGVQWILFQLNLQKQNLVLQQTGLLGGQQPSSAPIVHYADHTVNSMAHVCLFAVARDD